MRKLSPDSSIPFPSPCSFLVSIHLYICIYILYIYTYIYTHGGGQSTKTDGGTSGHCRSRSGDSKQPLYEAQCVTPLLRFLFAPQSYTCFPSIHVPSLLPSFVPDFVGGQNGSFSDNACLPSPILRPAKLFGETVQNSLMERVHLALLAL